jgi:5-formyltetrahydrofolate cyclo-ligase
VAEKRRLRRELCARRRGLSAAAALAAGRAVADHLLAEPALLRAARVALYAAMPDELPTRPLFDGLAATRAVRLLPRIRADALEFAAVESWDELRPGRYGVLEPPVDRGRVALGAGDVVVVPGVAFDASGNRLGRGGGYYDRAFAPGHGAAPLLVGVAYAFQLLDSVPHDSRDRAVDAIVSEVGLRWVPRAT